jgi:hypothetical protein
VALAKSTEDSRPQLLHDALGVLEKYSAGLGNRDPVKSLDDQNELLYRVRVALELLMSSSASHDEATDLVRRIDAVLATESPVTPRAWGGS